MVRNTSKSTKSMTGTLSPVPEYINIIIVTHSPFQRALCPLTLGCSVTESTQDFDSCIVGSTPTISDNLAE